MRRGHLSLSYPEDEPQRRTTGPHLCATRYLEVPPTHNFVPGRPICATSNDLPPGFRIVEAECVKGCIFCMRAKHELIRQYGCSDVYLRVRLLNESDRHVDRFLAVLTFSQTGQSE